MVQSQERRHAVDPLLDQPVEEDSAPSRDVPADEEVEIAEVPGEQRAAPPGAQRYPVAPLIGRVHVVLTPAIVELCGAAPDHDVGRGFFAEVELGSVEGEPHRGRRRDVLDVEDRQALRVEAVHRAHDETEPVGELEVLVDPRLRVRGKTGLVQLARRQQDLLIGAVQRVAVDVHVVEVIVESELLELAIRVEERSWIPPAEVLDGRGVGGEDSGGQLTGSREWLDGEAIQGEPVARPGDAASEVGRLEPELVGLDPVALEKCGAGAC